MEACWLSQTQEGQTEQIHPQTFDDPFFGQHWHDLHALGYHWTDSQQRILCLGFKGVQEEIPSEEASTLQIGSVVFPPGQCTSPQLHPCLRLWPRWASRQLLTLPIVQTLLPVTFAYSMSPRKNLEAVVMRQLRRWKLWQRSLTHSHKRTSMGPSRSCWNGTTSALQLEEITWKGARVSCVYYNKSAHTKKSGNLLNEPCVYVCVCIYIYIYIYIYILSSTDRLFFSIRTPQCG